MPHIISGVPGSSGSLSRSGFDAKSIVEKLVTVEKQPIDVARKKQSVLNEKLNAYTGLREALLTLKSAVTPLRSVEAFQPKSASTSNSQVVTATATSSAVLGTSTVNQVVQLAKPHKLQSGTFSAGTDSVGSGRLIVRVGEKAETIIPIRSKELGGSDPSLFDVRDAINAARAGVTASVFKLHESDYRLMIQANAGGAENNIAIDVINEEINGNSNVPGLSQLRFMPDSGEDNGLTEIQAAQDAIFDMDFTRFTRSTNTISDAIPGVTLTLLKETEENADIAVNVFSHAASVKEPIESFVSAYNNLTRELAKAQEFNPKTQSKGPLLGDAVARRLTNRLQALMSTRVPGEEYTSIVHFGITSGSDGILKINTAALESALMQNPIAVGRVFASAGESTGGGTSSGVADQIFQYISDVFHTTTGEVATHERNIKETITRIETDIGTKMKRVQDFEKRTRDRFAKLESVLERLEGTESGLVGQISQLGNLLGTLQNRGRRR